MTALHELNALPADEFVARLAGIFEHSPWVATRAAPRRPFASRRELLAALCTAVDEATHEEQLALIRAHPRLGSRGRSQAQLTAASAREQRGAGLQACTPRELEHLNRLNDAYHEKFSMPFILAVRGRDPASIIAIFESRLTNDPAAEHATALREIGLIAGLRLADAVPDTLSAEP